MIREKDTSKLIRQLLIGLLAISILMMMFTFVNPKPALASEETPPPQTDSIPLGCVCKGGPALFECCFEAYWHPGLGWLECVGYWYPYWHNMPSGCDYSG